ncbi:MAG: hypothetical protein ACXWBS_10590, partial [Chthoniobacterales bacterium]
YDSKQEAKLCELSNSPIAAYLSTHRSRNARHRAVFLRRNTRWLERNLKLWVEKARFSNVELTEPKNV